MGLDDKSNNKNVKKVKTIAYIQNIFNIFVAIKFKVKNGKYP